ncbi:hypothetical protein NIASO_05610 [Niabella soli DSM 19437]|uniref:Uncharacterized protein n=1 Tax=Niabella soli DSM 19437 TaxID=929713 RepID=W0F2R8_9BACT|nr:hypothetical protein NIASO_05610 [Niabella soli DSM 19437]
MIKTSREDGNAGRTFRFGAFPANAKKTGTSRAG